MLSRQTFLKCLNYSYSTLQNSGFHFVYVKEMNAYLDKDLVWHLPWERTKQLSCVLFNVKKKNIWYIYRKNVIILRRSLHLDVPQIVK